jgi:hypothetical protein
VGQGHHGRGKSSLAATATTKRWAETQPFLPKPGPEPLPPRHLPPVQGPLPSPGMTLLGAKATPGLGAKAGAMVGSHALLVGVGATVVTLVLVMVGVLMLGTKPNNDGANVETANLGNRGTDPDEPGDRPDVAPARDAATARPEPTTTMLETTSTVPRPTTTRAPSVVTTSPPSTDPPTPPSTDPPVTVVPAPVPEIARFDAQRGALCPGQSTRFDVRLNWTVREATSGTVAPQGGPATTVDLSTGRTNVCAERGSTWVLAITGPGGTTSQSATVPW